MAWGSRVALSLTEVESVQHIIAFIFSLKFWFISAYTNRLTAELRKFTVRITVNTTLSLFSITTWAITSVSQQIPNNAVTVMTIKVTRFRIFRAPCVYKHPRMSNWMSKRRNKVIQIFGKENSAFRMKQLTVFTIPKYISFPPPKENKLNISIVSDFSWDLQASQEIFFWGGGGGGLTRCIMGTVKKANDNATLIVSQVINCFHATSLDTQRNGDRQC